MLTEGQRFGDSGRYILIKKLGKGGFSEVWLAEDAAPGRQVAIKVYSPSNGLDSKSLEKFRHEYAAVFKMEHPNLLTPTDYDSWEGRPYITMPLCRQGSVYNKYIERRERISEQECWRLIHDVAAGLAYLHGRNPAVMHQDIKPDNILITDEGHYKIADFGISVTVRETIPKNKKFIGTLAYMAPERYSSRPKAVVKSDVWSLGATMFEIMTGVPPFGMTGGGLQMTTHDSKGAPIPEIDGDYSAELKSMVYKCMEEKPDDRPSAREIEQKAGELLNRQSYPAYDSVNSGANSGDMGSNSLPPWRPTPTPPYHPPLPKHSHVMMVALVVLIVVVLALIVFIVMKLV